MSDLTIKGFAVPSGTAKYDYNSLVNIPSDYSVKYTSQSLNPEQINQVWKNLGLNGAPSGGGSGGTGADGITPHIGANGNWFLGSVDTGVPATGPQGQTGEKGDKGDKGDTGEKGERGSPGKDGYTPVKGTDYWTEADKAEITEITKNSITPASIGATTLNEIQPLLNKKANDYSIEIYNGASGNPKPVKFATVDYSSCDSENGVAIKIDMVSGHGNGTSYAFLQEAIIRVNSLGDTEVNNLKHYGAATPTYDGAIRQYGDIFWVHDETNKIVEFYCLMGQYARLNMTPWKRLTYSSKGAITQHTSASIYSSGVKNWANNSNIVSMSDLIAKLNRTTSVNIADTNYTTLMARGTSLNSSETTPSVNGAIAWTYG